MSNFIETFKKGQLGKNFGYTFGLVQLDEALNGIQKKYTYGVAAAPKCGKTTFVDFCFVLSVYLEALRLGTLQNIKFIYFSYEIDRISKEFKFASFFMYNDYGILDYVYKGKTYEMDQDYLMGKKIHRNPDDTKEIIPITPEHERMLKDIYFRHIVVLFGEFSADGTRLSPGLIDFIEEPENPTGINKYLIAYAKKNGDFKEEEYITQDDKGASVKRKRLVGYKEHNEDLITIIITDHIRKLRKERGFSMKDNIDKYLEYSTILRNLCSFTFVHVCHSNRGLSNMDRLKYAGEYIFPTADEVKDSGNLAEECTVLMTLFNPNDEKYNLKSHFDKELKYYPKYRSIHITESRYTECPVHIQSNMYGGVNLFTPLNDY